MRRALAIVRAQLRASVALALQYRLEFLVEGALAILWIAVTLVPVLVVFGTRDAVEGWTFPEMLLVLGWFVALKGVLEGAVSPSLTAVIEHVRKGTLDFVLLKPADAQLLVSVAKLEPWRIVDLVGAGLIFAYAFGKLGRAPTAGEVLPSWWCRSHSSRCASTTSCISSRASSTSRGGPAPSSAASSRCSSRTCFRSP